MMTSLKDSKTIRSSLLKSLSIGEGGAPYGVASPLSVEPLEILMEHMEKVEEEMHIEKEPELLAESLDQSHNSSQDPIHRIICPSANIITFCYTFIYIFSLLDYQEITPWFENGCNFVVLLLV